MSVDSLSLSFGFGSGLHLARPYGRFRLGKTPDIRAVHRDVR